MFIYYLDELRSQRVKLGGGEAYDYSSDSCLFKAQDRLRHNCCTKPGL
jgi:hypothetical protein